MSRNNNDASKSNAETDDTPWRVLAEPIQEFLRIPNSSFNFATLLMFSLLYLTITYDQVLIHLWIKLVYVYVEEIW